MNPYAKVDPSQPYSVNDCVEYFRTYVAKGFGSERVDDQVDQDGEFWVTTLWIFGSGNEIDPVMRVDISALEEGDDADVKCAVVTFPKSREESDGAPPVELNRRLVGLIDEEKGDDDDEDDEDEEDDGWGEP